MSSRSSLFNSRWPTATSSPNSLPYLPSCFHHLNTFPRSRTGHFARLPSSSTDRVRCLSTTSSIHAAPPLPNPQKPRRRTRILLGGAVIVAFTAGGALWWKHEEDKRISPYRFTPLKLVSKTEITPETSVFRLGISPAMLPLLDGLSRSAILSLYVMQPDLQIQRPYTPLETSCFYREGSGVIELLVKRYKNGELSRWLHQLRPGDEIKVRGPVVTWDFGQQALDEVIFIVGGTGITPAYQFIKKELSEKTSATRISVVFSSPDESNILLRATLDDLIAQDPSRLSIQYLVDRGSSKKNNKLEVGRVNPEFLEKLIGKGGLKPNRVVVVCGPEGMVTAVAGPRARDLSQGPVGGILGRLGYTSQEVIKL